MIEGPTVHNSGPPVVLIVEDEEPIALALSFIVEDAGYQPLIAAHGKEGLEYARERKPALIITDLMMPKMSGLELIATLSQETASDHQRAPLVLMTAAGRDFTAEAGVDAVLLKPFEIEAVEDLLERFLGDGAPS